MEQYSNDITKEQIHAIIEDVYNKLPIPGERKIKLHWCSPVVYAMFCAAMREEAKKDKEDETN